MERVSICICTRNRAKDLKNAIQFIYQSTYKNFEIIVSDDSTNDESKKMVAREFSEVKYVKGPQKGLCFNRNNALKLVTGSRVLFIDDDVVMSIDFLEIIMTKLKLIELEKHEEVIITGIEQNKGLNVYPSNFNYLGHQAKAYRKDESLKTVVINSTIFPVSVFEKIKFDEQLVYGYDEVDIATRAVSQGYFIYLCDDAINNHYPSEINRGYYNIFKEASRIYVTYKRYNQIEKKTLKSLIYLPISFTHILAYQIRKRGPKGFINAFSTFKKVISYIKLLKGWTQGQT